MKSKHLVITIMFLITTSLSMAQSHNEEITIEGSYTPQIKKSERLIKMPDMPKMDFHIPSYEVNTSDFTYIYKLDLEPISPQQYNNRESYDIVNNFIKFGFGTRVSPDFLFHHYSDVTRSMSFGVGVVHNSTWLGMKDYPNSKYMNNAFSISTINRFSGFQLHSHIDYHYDMYDIDDDFDNDDDLGRKVHSLNVKFLANNNQTSYKSLYDEFLFDYSFSGIQNGMQENLLRLKAHFEHSNSWFRKKKDIQTLAVDIDAEVNNIKQTLFLIAANPHLDFDGDFYNIHLGFRLDMKTNSINMGRIYPDLKGSLYLFERNFELYAALGGKTKINTLKDILAENPFIISDLSNMGEFDYEETKLDFHGGVRFKVLNKVSAHLGIRYRNIDNMIFYVPSFENPGTFDIELSCCNIFNILADVNFRFNDEISVMANFSYNNYDMYVTHSISWYKPKTEFKLKGFYKYNDKWNFNIATYFEGERYAQSFDGNIEKMKPICDIQLGSDYNFSDKLSFYAEVRNLIHNKYQMYYGYPSYGFQMFVGFKYRF